MSNETGPLHTLKSEKSGQFKGKPKLRRNANRQSRKKPTGNKPRRLLFKTLYKKYSKPHKKAFKTPAGTDKAITPTEQNTKPTGKTKGA